MKQENEMMYNPKEFKENIDKGIITKKMLMQAAYSVNKRAKNCRDQKRKYKKHRYDRYNNYEKCLAKEKEYYNMKEKLLSVVNPDCIHHEIKEFETCIDYGYDSEKYEITNIHEVTKWEKSYVSPNEYYRYYSDNPDFKIDFYDRVYELCTRNYGTVREHFFYLYYDFSCCSFHKPIGMSKLSNYNGLEIREIENFVTYGAEVKGLCSVQMVRKIIELIDSGDYEFIA